MNNITTIFQQYSNNIPTTFQQYSNNILTIFQHYSNTITAILFQYVAEHDWARITLWYICLYAINNNYFKNKLSPQGGLLAKCSISQVINWEVADPKTICQQKDLSWDLPPKLLYHIGRYWRLWYSEVHLHSLVQWRR